MKNTAKIKRNRMLKPGEPAADVRLARVVHEAGSGVDGGGNAHLFFALH